MFKSLLYFLIISLISFTTFAAGTRTFSCNGTYDGDGAEFPLPSIHSETNYEESKVGTTIELIGDDSKVTLRGNLEIKGDKEFMKITLMVKESGLVIFNHNSQLGQPSQGKFNFVGLWLENFGNLNLNGKVVTPKSGSFQCQSYLN